MSEYFLYLFKKYGFQLSVDWDKIKKTIEAIKSIMSLE